MRTNRNHIFDSKLFTFNEKTNTFSSFLTDVIGNRDFSDLAKSLYDDAADLGFGIRNPQTGNVVYFVYENNTGEDMAVYNFVSFDFKLQLKCVIFGT